MAVRDDGRDSGRAALRDGGWCLTNGQPRYDDGSPGAGAGAVAGSPHCNL